MGKVCLGKLSEEDCKPLEKHLLICSARQDSPGRIGRLHASREHANRERRLGCLGEHICSPTSEKGENIHVPNVPLGETGVGYFRNHTSSTGARIFPIARQLRHVRQ